MKYHIITSDEAKLDIKEAKDYYSQIDSKLAKRCIADIITTIDRLAENPTHHQERYEGIRIAFTPIFPYGIHYILEKNTIFIIRVFHTKRFF
jgi:plasmid stabilization system protein ParE